MGFQYGHFEILTDEHGNPVKLGEGGMGITYKAWDKNLKLHAVVKVIHARLLDKPIIRKRFFNEARSAARIRHPNVASVIYCCSEEDTKNGDCFFAMEFINGESLQSRVQRHGPVPPGEALLMLRGIADALGALSHAGFIHRDIKPQNIMIERSSRGTCTKLIDFGLVKTLGANEPDLYQSLTAPDLILGSIDYASPEQVQRKKGNDLDCRSDFYSLGATLWYTISGFPPFTGSYFEVGDAHLRDEPPWKKIESAPEPAVGLLRLLLAKKREDRPHDAICLVKEWDAAIDQLKPRTAVVVLDRPPVVSAGGEILKPFWDDDSLNVGVRIPKPSVPEIRPQGDDAVDSDTASDNPAPPSCVQIIEPAVDVEPLETSAPNGALEELFPLKPNEISGCMLPPVPSQLAYNADGDWIAVRTVSGMNEHLCTEMLAMARRCLEAPHSRLLNVLAVGKDFIRSQWPCGISVTKILNLQGGTLPVELLLAWLPPLGEAVDWACAHGFHKTGMHPSQWLVTFFDDADSNPAQFATRRCEEWGAHRVHLDPLADFARDAAEAGVTSPSVTDPGIDATSLEAPAQWLAAFARAIYEIAGGTMNGKFAPLAVFGEESNRLLTLALSGSSFFESVSAWVVAFVGASGVRAPEPKPSEVRPAHQVTSPPALHLPSSAQLPPQPSRDRPKPTVAKADANGVRKFVPVFLILAVLAGALMWGKSMIADRSFVATPLAGVALDEGRIGGLVDLKLSGGQVIKLCYCPPGTFTMGSSKTEKDHSDDEGPVNVKIGKGYWMAQTEMTQAQWEAVMGNNPSNFKGEKLPVEMVSWEDAVACIKKMEGMVKMPAGWKLALPTEAQWEYACRAGTKTVFSFGNQLNGKEANCNGTTVKGPYLEKTVEVGKYPANEWGLYDMHGNVWEWCADWYDTTLIGGLDPKGPAKGDTRAFRGGCWENGPEGCRAGDRNTAKPVYHGSGLGFRLVVVRDEPDVHLSALSGGVDVLTKPIYSLVDDAAPPAGVALDEGRIGGIVDLKLSGGQVIKLCYCPPGTFTMGSSKTEKDHSDDEGPVNVQISKGYWMAQTEMTQAQWEAVMGSNPSNFKGANLPVEMVSWGDALECIEKLKGMVQLPAGWKLALPSEAQWEYACRAGTSTVFSFGDQLNGIDANCNGMFPFGTLVEGPNLKTTLEVGNYAANRWGLYDMHGNVWEWCADQYEVPQASTEPSTATFHGARGGSWNDSARFCRAAARGRSVLKHRSNDLGFRVVAVPAEP